MNRGGETACHVAARRGHTEVLRALVEAGADLTHGNSEGLTPLALARREKKKKAAYYLGDTMGVLNEEQVAEQEAITAEEAGGRVELYLYRPSVNCHGPWITLELSGIPYVLIDVDIEAKEHMSPEFRAMNPNCKVPLLRDTDGTCVWESNAIMRYICEKHNLIELYPRDPVQRARCDQVSDSLTHSLTCVGGWVGGWVGMAPL